MSQLFVVELKTYAVVLADNADDAEDYARHRASAVVRECPEVLPEVLEEVTHADDLWKFGWDDKCLPYGGDGERTIAAYLEAA